MTLAWSSRTTPATAQPHRFKMPSRRIRVPLKPGTTLCTILTVLVEDSTRRISPPKTQCSHTSGQFTLAPIRSRRPTTYAPRSLIPGAKPGSASRAPSSSA